MSADDLLRIFMLGAALAAPPAAIYASLPEDTEDLPTSSDSAVIRVGPGEPIASIQAAARVLRDTGILEVAAGDYHGQTVVWTQNNVTIRAVGGQARLFASGRSAEGKAIWVTRGNDITIEGFDFIGARVPEGNGAGIRHEKGRLLIRRCGFFRNELGLMTSNDPQAEIEIENSEFSENASARDLAHQIYIGAIKTMRITGSYLHHGRTGHLLKSRASQNYVAYNRMTDEEGGHSSYELEFPWGGTAYVIGNLIEQVQTTENPKIVSYGAEGYGRWAANALYLSHNTVVNRRERGGMFIFVHPGPTHVKAVNNLFVGRGSVQLGLNAESVNNLTSSWSDFMAPDQHDFRLKPAPASIAAPVASDDENGLRPKHEYTHPRSTRELNSNGPLRLGAFQAVEW